MHLSFSDGGVNVLLLLSFCDSIPCFDIWVGGVPNEYLRRAEKNESPPAPESTVRPPPRCLLKNIQWSVSRFLAWRPHWLISRKTTQLNVFRWIIYPSRHFQHRADLTRFQRANFQMVSTRSLISNPPLLFQDKLFEKCLLLI